MGTFLVETYLSPDASGEPDRTIDRAISAVDEMQRAGQAIRYVRAIFIPDDETCLLLYDAPSVALVRAATERAGLLADRIAPADSR